MDSDALRSSDLIQVTEISDQIILTNSGFADKVSLNRHVFPWLDKVFDGGAALLVCV